MNVRQLVVSIARNERLILLFFILTIQTVTNFGIETEMFFFFISLCLIVTRFVMNFNTWYKVETVEDCVFKCVVYHYAQTGRTNLAVWPPCNYDGTM